tara:strand:- start:3180 stop:5393 length:2214 start_codon:yes stop_codon:yes gene_type:complete
MKFSLFRNSNGHFEKDQAPIGELDLLSLYDSIKSNPQLQAFTQKYKDLYAEEGKSQDVKDLKMKFPFITPTGKFKVRNNGAMVEGSFTSLVPFDIDTQDNEGVDLHSVFENRICMSPEVALCFMSPSNGLKGLVAVQMNFNADTFADTIKDHLYPKLETQWGVKLDRAQASLSQPLFICHDAGVYCVPDAIPVPVEDKIADLFSGNFGMGTERQDLKIIQGLLKQLASAPGGQLHQFTLSVSAAIAAMLKGGVLSGDPEFYLELMWENLKQAPGLKDSKVGYEKLKSAFHNALEKETIAPITPDLLLKKNFIDEIGKWLRSQTWDENLPYVMVGNDYYEVTDDNRLLMRTSTGITKRHPGFKTIWDFIPIYREFVNSPNFVDFQQVIDGAWNISSPLTHKPQEGDWSTIGRLVNHLFGAWENERDQTELFYDWCKELLTNPKQKLIIPCLVSGTQGSAKSSLIELLMLIFGKNAFKLEASGLNREFNSSFADKLLVCLDELPKSSAEEFITTIKDLSTSKTIHVNPKGVTEYDIDCHLHFIMASNRMDEFIRVEGEDRRLWIREVPQWDQKKSTPDFKAKIEEEVPYFLNFLITRKEYHKREPSLRFFREDYATNRKTKAIEYNKSAIYHHITFTIKGEFEFKFIDCDKLVYNQTELYDMTQDMPKRPGIKEFKKLMANEFSHKEYGTHRVKEGQIKVTKCSVKKGYLFNREEVGADSLEGIKDELVVKSNNIFAIS